MQGVVKVYDPESGYGVISRDDGGEIYLGPGSLDGSIFRTLRQGQRLVFEVIEDGGQQFARRLRVGSDGY